MTTKVDIVNRPRCFVVFTHVDCLRAVFAGSFGTVAISADNSESEERPQGYVSAFTRNRNSEAIGSPEVIRDGSLRQRGGAAAAQVEIEESLLQPDHDAPLRADSMSLFATLVPPPLRKSKKDFTSGENHTHVLNVWWIACDLRGED